MQILSRYSPRTTSRMNIKLGEMLNFMCADAIITSSKFFATLGKSSQNPLLIPATIAPSMLFCSKRYLRIVETTPPSCAFSRIFSSFNLAASMRLKMPSGSFSMRSRRTEAREGERCAGDTCYKGMEMRFMMLFSSRMAG